MKKKDGTRGVLKMDNAWHLYGKFTGDVIGGKITGKISGNGTLKINNASVQIVSAEQVSPDKTAYFDGINYRTQ